MKNGELTKPADAFDQPFGGWDASQISHKALEIRKQGFSGAAMLNYKELEYDGIAEKMKKLDVKFKFRK